MPPDRQGTEHLNPQDVFRKIDQVAARISERQSTQLARLSAHIRTAAEADEAMGRRRDLLTEKPVVKQRNPWDTQR
jgi:hypothetical protein